MGSGRRFNIERSAAGLALIVSLAGGCNESLPPRLADPNAISVSAAIEDGPVTVFSGTILGDGGAIDATVTNVYTEVLQDSVAVDIRCRIWLADVPDSDGVAALDASTLTNPRLIQNGMLTLLPRDVATFHQRWTYTTRGGTPFWSLIPLKDTANMRGPFKISAPVEVLMTDTVRVFRPVPEYVVGPVSRIVQFEVW